MTTDMRTTQELPAVGAIPVAEHEPHHVLRNWSPECDLADTQELPAVPETRPASEWSPESLERCLADVQAVGR